VEEPAPAPPREAVEAGAPEAERARVLLERAYSLRKDGDLAGALACCEQALQARPDSAAAHSLRAQLYVAQGRRDLAILEYERVLELNPDSVADRILLDELRGAGPPAGQPQIVMAGERPPVFRARDLAAAAFAGAALMALGGLLALQFVPRAHLSPPQTTVPSGAALGTSSPTNGAPQAALTNATASGNEPKTTFVYPPAKPAETQIVYVPAPPRVSGSGTIAAQRVRTAETNRADEIAETGGRVRLPSESVEVQRTGEGAYIIPVGSKTPSETGKAPDKAAGTNSIRLTPDQADATTGARPAASDARSYIALGDEQKAKEQYTQAIAAYRKALPIAGDETGYVCQRIAVCYESRGDRSAAKKFYEDAVSAFQKLEAAGRLTEAARSAMNACELGIKTCDNG
jgi:tetratricopeptide (TPR) repeat protein